MSLASNQFIRHAFVSIIQYFTLVFFLSQYFSFLGISVLYTLNHFYIFFTLFSPFLLNFLFISTLTSFWNLSCPPGLGQYLFSFVPTLTWTHVSDPCFSPHFQWLMSTDASPLSLSDSLVHASMTSFSQHTHSSYETHFHQELSFCCQLPVWISRITCFERTLCHTKFYAILLVLVYIFILAKLFINSPRGVAKIFFPLNLYCVTQCLKHCRCSINKNKLGWEVRKLSKRYWSHSEKAAEILQTMEHLNLILKN